MPAVTFCEPLCLLTSISVPFELSSTKLTPVAVPPVGAIRPLLKTFEEASKYVTKLVFDVQPAFDPPTETVKGVVPAIGEAAVNAVTGRVGKVTVTFPEPAGVPLVTAQVAAVNCPLIVMVPSAA